MKKLILILFILGIYSLCGECWGAIYCVSPSGDDSDPTSSAWESGDWSSCYHMVHQAVNAVSADGDFIVLENVTNQSLAYVGASSYSYTMRNELNDENAENCVVNITLAANLNRPSAGNDKDYVIKGITFKGDTETVTYDGDGNTRYALFQSYNQTGDLTLIGVVIDGLSQSVDANEGPVFFLRGAVGNEGVVTIIRTEIKNSKGSTGGTRSLAAIKDLDVVIDSLNFHDNGGDSGDASGGQWDNYATVRNISVSVTNSTFTDNYHQNGTAGDGVFKCENLLASGYQTTLTVSNARFEGNTVGQGTLYVGKNTIANIGPRNYFINNTASANGGALRLGGEDDDEVNALRKVFGNIFVNNTATSGGALSISQNRDKLSQIYQNTFLNNVATGGNGHDIVSADAVTGITYKAIVKNNIFWGDAIGSGYRIYGYGNDGFSEISHNIIEGGISNISDTGATISDIISSDPLFVSSTDFNLTSGSPAISAGTVVAGFHDQDTPAQYYDGKNILWNPSIGAHGVSYNKVYIDGNTPAGGNGTQGSPFNEVSDLTLVSGTETNPLYIYYKNIIDIDLSSVVGPDNPYVHLIKDTRKREYINYIPKGSNMDIQVGAPTDHWNGRGW